MSTSLQGLTAIVTGAGRGLGRAEALELARSGANVVVNDFGAPGRDGSGAASAAPADETVAEIRALGGQAVAHYGDVADLASAKALVDLAVETYGQLDILVNNAGILRDRMVFSMSEEEWDSVIHVHLKGHFATTRFVAAHWRDRSKAAGAPVYGRIVNTSSEAFVAGSAGQPNYAAAKGGIVGLTTSSASALARYGVTANVICPRARTRMTEDVFTGSMAAPSSGIDPLAPEHVSPLVAYLASPAAGNVNGQCFVVHGGMVAVLGAPPVLAKFDTAKEAFTPGELDELMSPFYAERRPGDGFANMAVLGLKHGG
ncbi:3-oxoacyl-ACP reductase [Streptacidiphilus fuscans]|uniref:3-oxoacyl-ACP reductase n=1 Tax=Streptacidiphilus fuscans TaxID=2789292 RepID=A0A931FIM2_9ACTN|nr:3-oxoacyl-ACP reductase [Streptacidiphilus fuscans]MBF9073071.1 3-oxoacyl-ACP reductase [Streptacidiphilus fuscans]